jgi:hypothetical protein
MWEKEAGSSGYLNVFFFLSWKVKLKESSIELLLGLSSIMRLLKEWKETCLVKMCWGLGVKLQSKNRIWVIPVLCDKTLPPQPKIRNRRARELSEIIRLRVGFRLSPSHRTSIWKMFDETSGRNIVDSGQCSTNACVIKYSMWMCWDVRHRMSY